MRGTITKWFAPPVFESDEEKTRLAGLLNSILLFMAVATLLATPFLLASTDSGDRLTLSILLAPFLLINAGAFMFMRRGYVSAASYMFLFSLGVAIFGAYAFSTAESSSSLLAIMIVLAFTNALLGGRAILRLVGFVIIFTFAVTIGQIQGWLVPVFARAADPIGIWLTSALVFVLTGLGIYLSSIGFKQALDKANDTRRALLATNQELATLQKALETRDKERTVELEKRAIYLQAVSNLANATASMQDIDTLLPDVTNLVSERFGFYHAGIFLVDEKNGFAVLQAANSEGGKRMLDRQHKVPLDTNSMVGFAASLGQPRVSLDVVSDSVYFSNPDLPNTRSEMALPLLAGNRVIGVLDVQSTHHNAFTKTDIDVLAILANQVAIAIENARLFREARAALAESQETVDKYVRQEWKSFSRQMRQNGFTFDGRQVTPLLTPGQSERARHIAQTGRLSLEKASANISIPIKLRGQTIGILEARPRRGQREWTDDEIALLEAAADRAAVALENARLVETAQRRASRERAIGEIAARIGTVSERNLILQAAVEGLGRKIGNSEIIIELDTHIEDSFDSKGALNNVD